MKSKPIVAPNLQGHSETWGNAGRAAWSRRDWLVGIAALSAFTPWTRHQLNPAAASEGSALASFRVRSVLELSGEVRLKNQGVAIERRNGKQVVARTAPVRSTSTLDYDEQYRLGVGDQPDRCVQFFHEATSEITVDQHVTKTVLREPCQEIVRILAPSGMLTTSPAQPLFAAERDLVEGTMTTMYLDQILTERHVAAGDQWTVDSTTVCRLFNLDAIQSGVLTVQLDSTDDKQANLSLRAQLTASVRNVATELSVEGKAILDRKLGHVSWLAIQVEETREIGEAEPGFKITARLRVLRAPIEEITSGRGLDAALAEIPSLASASMLQFQSDLGYYRFLADRRWSTYRDNGEEATLRFVVSNRRVAQCTVLNLVDFEAGRQLSLEGYQTDVQRLIQNKGYEILEASEKLSGTSHRLLRIVVGGAIEGIPIRWIYYHISNDTGRRLSMIFTLDEGSLEMFEEQDQQLAGTIELLPWPKKLDPKALPEGDDPKVDGDAITQSDKQPSAKKPPAEKAAARPAASSPKR